MLWCFTWELETWLLFYYCLRLWEHNSFIVTLVSFNMAKLQPIKWKYTRSQTHNFLFCAKVIELLMTYYGNESGNGQTLKEKDDFYFIFIFLYDWLSIYGYISWSPKLCMCLFLCGTFLMTKEIFLSNSFIFQIVNEIQYDFFFFFFWLIVQIDKA